jgi:hypothetical protein
MLAQTYLRAVTMDEVDLLPRLLAVLADERATYCAIGGQAVNAYVEPLVSLDLDLAVAAGEAERLRPALEALGRVERFAHSLNLTAAGSDLRVQLQTDPRYESFPARAEVREVLGHHLPVARVEDVLQGKIWAASDPGRRGSKRQKDLADIARLVEAHPHLRVLVPAELRARLFD